VPSRADDSVISQDISGFSLPGVQLPQGADEVRAADGTTCRSAVSGNGAYLDVGLMGKPGAASKDVSAYGRVVVPLGAKGKRLDCTKLYDLEVERLRMELELTKMGLGSQGRMADVSDEAAMAPSDEKTAAIGDDDETPAKPAKAKKKSKVKAKSSGDDWADEGWSSGGSSE